MLIFCLDDDDVHVKSDFCVALIFEVIYTKVMYKHKYFKFCDLNAFNSEAQIYIYVHRSRCKASENDVVKFPFALSHSIVQVSFSLPVNVVWFHFSVFSFLSAPGHWFVQGRGGQQQRGRALAGIACVVQQMRPGRTGSCGSGNVAQDLHLGSVGNFSVVGSCLADSMSYLEFLLFFSATIGLEENYVLLK